MYIIEKLDGTGARNRQHHCVFIICRDKRNELVRPSDNKCSGDLDIGIVTDHMMLAAREKGVGSVMMEEYTLQ